MKTAREGCGKAAFCQCHPVGPCMTRAVWLHSPRSHVWPKPRAEEARLDHVLVPLLQGLWVLPGKLQGARRRALAAQRAQKDLRKLHHVLRVEAHMQELSSLRLRQRPASPLRRLTDSGTCP